MKFLSLRIFVLFSLSAVLASFSLADTVAPNPPTGFAAGTIATPIDFDDFSSYANTAAFLANVGTIGAGKRYSQIDSANGVVTIDPTVQHDGHQTARLRFYTAGGNTAPRWIINGTNLTNIWVRWICRWEPGWSLDLKNGYTGGKSHKQTLLSFNGVYGRSMGAFGNGTGSPGGLNNDGDYIWETNHRSNTFTVFLSPTLRRVIEGSSKMFNDGKWYEHIVHFERVGTSFTRTRIWIQEYGQPRTLLGTINHRDADVPTPNGVDYISMPTNFNQYDIPVPAGLDQSIWYSRWEKYDGVKTPDPFGLGITPDPTRDITASIGSSAITVSRGASTQQTITVNRGAAYVASGYIHPIPIRGLPTGVTASYSANSLAPGVSTVTLTLAAASTATVGSAAVNAHFTVSDSRTGNDTGVKGIGAASNFLPLTITVN